MEMGRLVKRYQSKYCKAIKINSYILEQGDYVGGNRNFALLVSKLKIKEKSTIVARGTRWNNEQPNSELMRDEHNEVD